MNSLMRMAEKAGMPSNRPSPAGRNSIVRGTLRLIGLSIENSDYTL